MPRVAPRRGHAEDARCGGRDPGGGPLGARRGGDAAGPATAGVALSGGTGGAGGPGCGAARGGERAAGPGMTRPAPGAARERTVLAWWRTALAATVVAVLFARLAGARGIFGARDAGGSRLAAHARGRPVPGPCAAIRPRHAGPIDA